MYIERLRLVNFRQHEDTELVLGPGLTGIIGPNGAGRRHCSKRSPGVSMGPKRPGAPRRRSAGEAPSPSAGPSRVGIQPGTSPLSRWCAG